MLNVEARRCRFAGCPKLATSGLKGEPKTRCAEHATEGMTGGRKRCAHEGCQTFPTYALQGQQREFCLRHAKASSTLRQCVYVCLCGPCTNSDVDCSFRCGWDSQHLLFVLDIFSICLVDVRNCCWYLLLLCSIFPRCMWLYVSCYALCFHVLFLWIFRFLRLHDALGDRGSGLEVFPFDSICGRGRQFRKRQIYTLCSILYSQLETYFFCSRITPPSSNLQPVANLDTQK